MQSTDSSDPLVAAWGGRWLEITGLDSPIDLSARPAAILGASLRNVYLLTRFGVLSLDLATVRAFTDSYGCLAVSGVADNGARARVTLGLDMPVAIATQLDEMGQAAAAVRTALSSPAPRRLAGRPRSRRTEGL